MNSEARGYWKDGEWKGTLVVGALMASILFGLGMWIYTGTPEWLLFCIPIFIFLS